MFDSDEEREIAQSLEATHLPRAEHKAKLEAELLAQFDRQQGEGGRRNVKKHNVKRILWGLGMAAALGIAACAAPVEVDVAVGRIISVTYAAGPSSPAPREVAQAIEGLGHFDNVKVQVRRKNDDTVVKVELLGQEAGEKTFAEEIKKALPALASAKIDEEPLSGTMDSTLGKKIGHELFDIDLAGEKDVEALKEKILAQLAAQGVEGQVNVEVKDEGEGTRKVKIEVRKEECEPGTEIEEKIGP